VPRPIPSPLSVVLTALRAQAGWTESELAADLGVSKSLISDYERGKKNLRREPGEKRFGSFFAETMREPICGGKRV